MISRKITLLLLANIFKDCLGYVSLFFVARYMGPYALGVIGFAMAFLGMLSFVEDLGIGTAHIKRISEGRDLGKCIGNYISLKILSNILFALVVLGFILMMKFVFNRNFETQQHEIIIYIFLASTLIGNFSMICTTTFSARKETAKQIFPVLFGKLVEVGLKVFVALAGLSVIMLAGANLVATILIFLAFLFLFYHYPIRPPSMEYFKSYLSFALPVAVIVFVNSFQNNLDKVMIQFFWNSEEVGFYVGGGRIAAILGFSAVAVGTLIFPTISKYHSEGNYIEIKRLSHSTERYVLMFLVPIGVLISIFPKDIIFLILGKRFFLSSEILVILAWAMIITAATIPYSNQILATGRTGLATRLSLFILGCNLLMNLFFIPRSLFGINLLGLGAVGAALATLSSTFISSILFRISAYRITRTPQSILVLKHLGAGGFVGLCIYFIYQRLEILPLYSVVFLGGLTVLFHFLALSILGEFGRNEIKSILDTLNIVKMKDYVTSELRSSSKVLVKH